MSIIISNEIDDSSIIISNEINDDCTIITNDLIAATGAVTKPQLELLNVAFTDEPNEFTKDQITKSPTDTSFSWGMDWVQALNDNSFEIRGLQDNVILKFTNTIVTYIYRFLSNGSFISEDNVDLGTTGLKWKELFLSSFANVLGVKSVENSATKVFASDGSVVDVGITDLVEDTTPQLGGELDLNGHSVGGNAQSATGDGTTTIDWKLGNFFHFQFGAFNETFTFTNPTKAGTFILRLIQDGTGSRTATFPASVKWIGGTAPTLTTTATTGTDIITLYFDGTNYYGVEALNFS